MNQIFQFKGIRIHHAAIDMRQFDDPVATIRDWHVNGRGWSDIGYHALVHPETGEIFPGRTWDRTGAHDLHENDCFGICLMANYSEELPNAVALGSGAMLCALVSQLVGNPLEIQGHREWDPVSGVDATDCPGLNFDMDEFRALCAGYAEKYKFLR